MDDAAGRGVITMFKCGCGGRPPAPDNRVASVVDMGGGDTRVKHRDRTLKSGDSRLTGG